MTADSHTRALAMATIVESFAVSVLSHGGLYEYIYIYIKHIHTVATLCYCVYKARVTIIYVSYLYNIL